MIKFLLLANIVLDQSSILVPYFLCNWKQIMYPNFNKPLSTFGGFFSCSSFLITNTEYNIIKFYSGISVLVTMLHSETQFFTTCPTFIINSSHCLMSFWVSVNESLGKLCHLPVENQVKTVWCWNEKHRNVGDS